MPLTETELKEIISSYLKGQAIHIIELRLQEVSSQSGCDSRTYYQSIPLNIDDPYLIAFRTQLNINQESFNTFIDKSDNLYDLLTNLSQADHHHLHYFLKLVDKTSPPPNWGLIFSLGALVTATFGLIFHFKKRSLETAINWISTTFPLAIRWLNKTFSVLRNISLLGIIYNSVDLLATWYHAFFDHTHSNTLKVNHLFFRTLQSGFTIAAYSLTCLAGGTMALPIASLFVLSASMDVFKSLVIRSYSENAIKRLKAKPQAEDSAWEALAENKRAENYWHHALESVQLKVIAALLTTIAVCVLSFSSPSILVTVSCISFINLVLLAKKSFSERIERKYAEQLQAEIKKIEPSIKPESDPAHAKILQRLKNEKEEVNQEKAEVIRHEASVKAREDMLEATLEAIRQGQHSLFGGKREHQRSQSFDDMSSSLGL